MANPFADTAHNDRSQLFDKNDNAMAREYNDIQVQIHETTDKSLESTRRMVTMMAESEQVGVSTIVALDQQGEQLRNIDQNMDKMSKDMSEAESNLHQMEKCCGCCVLPWKRAKKISKLNVGGGGDANESGALSDKYAERQPVNAQPGAAGAQGGYIQRITGDAREDEMDDNLTQVGGMLGNLKSMALDMNTTLDSQNKVIDNITRKADHLDSRVVAANQRTNQIIRN